MDYSVTPKISFRIGHDKFNKALYLDHRLTNQDIMAEYTRCYFKEVDKQIMENIPDDLLSNLLDKCAAEQSRRKDYSER